MTNNLPSDYQEVLYVQNTGTQYINTGHMHSNTDSYELGIMFTSAPAITYQKVFGAATSNYASEDCIQLEANNNTDEFHFRTVWYPQSGIDICKISLNVRYDLTLDNTQTRAVRYDTSTTKTYSGNVTTATMADYLFTVNSSETSTQISTCRIYYFRIYDDNDNLVCKLIPCYRKLDGRIGMYEMVSGTFKTFSGTGVDAVLIGEDVVDDEFNNFKSYQGHRTINNTIIPEVWHNYHTGAVHTKQVPNSTEVVEMNHTVITASSTNSYKFDYGTNYSSLGYPYRYLYKIKYTPSAGGVFPVAYTNVLYINSVDAISGLQASVLQPRTGRIITYTLSSPYVEIKDNFLYLCGWSNTSIGLTVNTTFDCTVFHGTCTRAIDYKTVPYTDVLNVKSDTLPWDLYDIEGDYDFGDTGEGWIYLYNYNNVSIPFLVSCVALYDSSTDVTADWQNYTTIYANEIGPNQELLAVDIRVPDELPGFGYVFTFYYGGKERTLHVGNA